MTKYITFIMISIVLLLNFTFFTSAQVDEISTTEIKGTVLKVEDNNLTIQTEDDNTLELTIPGNIRVLKDGVDSTREEVNVNDEIIAMVNSDNEIVEIDVTSDARTDLTSNLLTAAIILLLLMGIAYWVWRKSNTSHIKTTSTNLNS